MEGKRYEIYYNIGGSLRIISFDDSREFNEIAEDVEVSNGEDGISVKLLFVRRIDDNGVITPDFAFDYFRVHCETCGEILDNARKHHCSEHCASKSDKKNAVCMFRGSHDYSKSDKCAVCGKTRGGG